MTLTCFADEFLLLLVPRFIVLTHRSSVRHSGSIQSRRRQASNAWGSGPPRGEGQTVPALGSSILSPFGGKQIPLDVPRFLVPRHFVLLRRTHVLEMGL